LKLDPGGDLRAEGRVEKLLDLHLADVEAFLDAER
jgi:hypothetical protein